MRGVFHACEQLGDVCIIEELVIGVENPPPRAVAIFGTDKVPLLAISYYVGQAPPHLFLKTRVMARMTS